MIELAAACWKLDPLEAFSELLGRGLQFPTIVTNHVGHQKLRRAWVVRKRIAEFLAEGRQNLYNDAMPAATQALLQITRTGSMDAELRERLGAFVIATSRQKVRELVGVRSFKRVPRLLVSSDDWRDVLAIPHHSLPNKISGLTLISETSEGQVLTGFLPIDETTAGLGGLPAWHNPPGAVGDRLFVTTDAALYLHLHARHLRTSGRALPLLLAANTQQARTTAVGRNMRARPITIVGRQDEIQELVRLGRLCDGDVTQHVWSEAVSMPLTFLQSLQRRAHNWWTVLQYNLLHLDATAATTLVRHVEVTSQEMIQLAQKASPKLKARLEQLQLAGGDHGIVEVNGKAVRFDTNGWHTADATICDAHIRLDHKLFLKNKRACYVGHVIRGERAWPITLRVTKTLQPQFLQFVAAELALHGEVLNYRRDWSSRAFQIAIAAHPPTDKYNVDQVGWDRHAGIIRLPTFTLGVGGKVSLGHVTAFPARPPVPAANIPPPGILAGADFLEIADQPARDVIWAIMIGVLQNVLAPVINQRPEGVVITGDGSRRVGNQIAEALGCPRFALPFGDLPTERLAGWADHHNWPIFFDMIGMSPSHHPAMRQWLDIPGDKNAICAAPWLTAYALATRGWLVIDCDAGVTATASSLTTAARIMSGYMRDLLTRNGRLYASMDTARETIMADLSEWCRNTFGSPLPVQHIRTYLPYGSHTPLWHGFLTLIEHCVRKAYRLRTIQIITEHPHAISVSLDDLNRVLATQDTPQLDFATITESLASTGALLIARSPDGTHGWTFNREWWERHYKRTRVNHAPQYILPIAN